VGEELHLIAAGGGRLGVGHRPKVKALAGLRAAGVTHLATLLSEAEEAKRLGAAAAAAGLVWLWLPLPNGDPPPEARRYEIREALSRWGGLLASGAGLYLHCSAGIHRTGMIAYALLRSLGRSAEEARRDIAEMRPLTAAGVGEARLSWGDQFGVLW
jgi:protein-tyrosine phosphatase